MTDLSEMTEAERTRVLAAIQAQQPVRIRRPGDGRIVPVVPDRVQQRFAAGYTIVTPEN